MTSRRILDFVLSCYVEPHQCIIINAAAGECGSDYFPDLADDTKFISDGTFFCFFSDSGNIEYDLKKLFDGEDRLTEFPEYEFPTRDGFWFCVRIDD